MFSEHGVRIIIKFLFGDTQKQVFVRVFESQL